MAHTMEFIASASPSGTYLVEFSNVPQHFQHLVIYASTRSATNGGAVYSPLAIAFQYPTEILHTTRRFYFVNTSVGSDTYNNQAQTYSSVVNDADTTANTFASSEIWIHNYSTGQPKVLSGFCAAETNSAYGVVFDTLGAFTRLSPITQILVFNNNAYNFVAGSTISLYGVRGAASTAGTFGIDATGGDVTISGGYKYHVFRSSGVLTVAQPGWAEVLVVGGGGGAAYGKTGTYFGVPGGAGQVQLFSSLLQSSPYMVAVGAGGAGAGSTLDVNGSGGTMSSLGSLVASGGGGGLFNTGVGGSSGNGFTGGNPSSANTGGGGGATASGANATGGGGGAGGAGTSAYSAWGVATSTGQDVSGTRWYGGGGGGTTNGAGGNGGGGASKAAGSANTGGGAGGGEYAAYPALAGGSGIVIIRYPAT